MGKNNHVDSFIDIPADSESCQWGCLPKKSATMELKSFILTSTLCSNRSVFKASTFMLIPPSNGARRLSDRYLAEPSLRANSALHVFM